MRLSFTMREVLRFMSEGGEVRLKWAGYLQLSQGWPPPDQVIARPSGRYTFATLDALERRQLIKWYTERVPGKGIDRIYELTDKGKHVAIG